MTPWQARATAARARIGPLVPALRVAGFAGAVAIVVVMGFEAARDAHLGSVTWWPLAPAALLAGVWWLLLARGWALLVSGRPTRYDVSVWCRTQALRYLPGGLWAPASRGVLLRGAGLDRLWTVAAENVLALCAALALGGLALAFAGAFAWTGLALVIALPPLAARWTARHSRVEPRRVRRAQLEYLVAFAAYLAASVLVQAAVSGWHAPLWVAGAAGIAWAAGLVVVVAPGGIGVRELVYVELLRAHFPHGELVAAALTFRVVTIVAELAALLIAGRPVEGETKNREG
jgi:glycosyltransferase 2 family protein